MPVQRPFSSQPRPPPNSAAPSERRPLAGLGKGPGPNEAAGLAGTLGPGNRDARASCFCQAQRRPRACLSAGYGSRASVSLAAAASSATTSAAYFRQLFLSSSTQPSPRMRPAPAAPDWALPSAPLLKNQSGQK